MIETVRLAMPMMVPGQMNKEVTVNSALQIADAMLCPVVEAMPTGTPPSSPSNGQCFAVDVGATGDWNGRDGAIASWSDAGWLFVEVPEGATYRDRNTGVPVVRSATGWVAGVVCADRLDIGGVPVVQAQQGAIADPSGGSTIDAQARTAVGDILAVLRAHGLIAT